MKTRDDSDITYPHKQLFILFIHYNHTSHSLCNKYEGRCIQIQITEKPDTIRALIVC